MLNDFAKEVYDEHAFGLPVILDQELDIITWGHPGNNKYAFITPSNRENLVESPSHQTLQDLALAITGNKLSEAEEVGMSSLL